MVGGTWPTCSRLDTSRLTGPNIQLINVVSLDAKVLAPGTMHEKTSHETSLDLGSSFDLH